MRTRARVEGVSLPTTYRPHGSVESRAYRSGWWMWRWYVRGTTMTEDLADQDQNDREVLDRWIDQALNHVSD